MSLKLKVVVPSGEYRSQVALGAGTSWSATAAQRVKRSPLTHSGNRMDRWGVATPPRRPNTPVHGAFHPFLTGVNQVAVPERESRHSKFHARGKRMNSKNRAEWLRAPLCLEKGKTGRKSLAECDEMRSSDVTKLALTAQVTCQDVLLYSGGGLMPNHGVGSTAVKANCTHGADSIACESDAGVAA